MVSPGANHYRPKANITRPNAKSTIVFKSERVDFSKTITGAIGPGQYDLKFDNSKGEAGKIGSVEDLNSTQGQQMYFSNLLSLELDTTIFLHQSVGFLNTIHLQKR